MSGGGVGAGHSGHDKARWYCLDGAPDHHSRIALPVGPWAYPLNAGYLRNTIVELAMNTEIAIELPSSLTNYTGLDIFRHGPRSRKFVR